MHPDAACTLPGSMFHLLLYKLESHQIGIRHWHLSLQFVWYQSPAMLCRPNRTDTVSNAGCRNHFLFRPELRHNWHPPKRFPSALQFEWPLNHRYNLSRFLLQLLCHTVHCRKSVHNKYGIQPLRCQYCRVQPALPAECNLPLPENLRYDRHGFPAFVPTGRCW